MDKYIILADVTCDLSAEVREYFGIEDYIRGHVHFSDDRDFETTLDWSNVSREEFYKALSNKKLEVSTAPATFSEEAPADAEVYYAATARKRDAEKYGDYPECFQKPEDDKKKKK